MTPLNRLDLTDDPVLTDLLEELSKRLEAGEVIDLESYASRYPGHADELYALVPVLARLAGLSKTSHTRATESGTLKLVPKQGVQRELSRTAGDKGEDQRKGES